MILRAKINYRYYGIKRKEQLRKGGKEIWSTAKVALKQIPHITFDLAKDANMARFTKHRAFGSFRFWHKVFGHFAPI